MSEDEQSYLVVLRFGARDPLTQSALADRGFDVVEHRGLRSRPDPDGDHGFNVALPAESHSEHFDELWLAVIEWLRSLEEINRGYRERTGQSDVELDIGVFPADDFIRNHRIPCADLAFLAQAHIELCLSVYHAAPRRRASADSSPE